MPRPKAREMISFKQNYGNTGLVCHGFYENTSGVITSHILKILKVKYIGPIILLPLYMLGLVDQ
jgi:hypothetical protein